ncbi:hypothetical protein ACHAWF_004376 [Thalassiosira exigua]
MPTLRLIDDAPATEKEEEARVRAAGDRRNEDEEGEGDERFSQPPPRAADERAEGRKRAEASAFSIASALRRRRSGRDIDGGGGGAADVVAVVLSAPIRRERPLPASSGSRAPARRTGLRATLLLGDRSLRRGTCARVASASASSGSSARAAFLLGVDGAAVRGERLGGPGAAPPPGEGRARRGSEGRIAGPLRPGDVVRWNRLEVRSDYGDEEGGDDLAAGQKRKATPNSDEEGSSRRCRRVDNPLLSVTCDLAPSWRDPVAGPSLARLCRIVPRPEKSGDGYEYELDWEAVVPPGMETPREVVEDLARWYCAHATAHFAKGTAIAPANRSCQRRRLRDIDAINMLSHVVVKVLRCEKAMTAHSTPSKTTKEDAILTHATLSDGSGSDDLLGMRGSDRGVGGSGAFQSLPKTMSATLLRSMREGSLVFLTHVLSQSANASSMGAGASLHDRESLVLVPTRDTTAAILTPDHPYFVRECSSGGGENLFASQPLSLERASQLLSMTQQRSPPHAEGDAAGDRRGAMVVIAPLMDVVVDGVGTSLVEGAHWRGRRELSRFLVDCPAISTGMQAIELKPSYRSATLILDPNCVSSDIVVNADGDALKLLCLDVPAEDMAANDATIATNPYLGHVGDMLRTLCSEAVPVRWVLEQESECNWFVASASLLEI